MLWLAALSIGLTTVQPLQPIQTPDIKETVAQRDARMRWWREARFGMFIHWGLYAVASGEWNGKEVPGAGEWLMNSAQVKPEDYHHLINEFNPTKFDADKWVSIAKNAGMKYIVITSKHHEGFGLWPSKLNEWNIGFTPYKKDVLKALAVACKKQGIKLCFYHSIMDWTDQNYLPRRAWDTRPASQADFDKYVTFMKGQLKELLSGDYGDIGLLWFDGEWEGTWTHERGVDLYNYVRSLQPNIIINNRVDHARGGFGDYGTPEQTIPANGMPGMDWESCMTMNDTWGFHKYDQNWKSSATLIKNLIECSSKGGNYLLNVGPTPEGLIPWQSQSALADMGRWLKRNGEAIYGSQAGPFTQTMAWGRATQKPGKLYLEVFDDAPATISLGGLTGNLSGAKMLVGGQPVRMWKEDGAYMLDLSSVKRTSPATVIAVDVSGSLGYQKASLMMPATGAMQLQALDASTTGGAAYEGGDKQAIGYWTDAKDTVTWEFEAKKAGRYSLSMTYACEAGSEGSTVNVAVGGSNLSASVAATGGWSSFKTVAVGDVDVPAGKTKVVVSVKTMPTSAVMNLRSLTVTPK